MLLLWPFFPLLAFGFVSRAPLSTKWRLGSLDNQAQIQPKSPSRYYRNGSTLVLLPKYQRQRNAKLAVLEKASTAPDYSVKELLGILSSLKIGQQLEDIDPVFSSICKWFYFKHQELVNDPNFTQLRETLRRTHYIFGRVYSRIIKRLVKFKNCFPTANQLRDVDIYVMYKDRNLLEYSNLASIINECAIRRSTPLPNTALLRVHAIFKDTLDKDEKIQLMKKHVRPCIEPVKRKRAMLRQYGAVDPPGFITSTFGTFLHTLLEETRLPRHQRIEMVTDVCRFDFGVSRPWLEKLSVVDAQNANAWAYTALSDLSAQVYKMFLEIEKFPMDPSIVNGTLVLSQDVPDVFELGAMYFYARLQALASINDNDAIITELLRQIAEFVGFMNVLLHETQKTGHCHYKIAMLRELLFGEYLKHIIFNVHGCNPVIYSRLNALYKNSIGQTDPNKVKTISLNVGRAAYFGGMSGLCSMINYTPPANMLYPESQTQATWAILKGKSVYLYNFEEDVIAASMDVTVMDAYNSGNRSALDVNGATCQLVLQSLDHTWSNDNVIDRIQAKMDSLKAPFGPLKFEKLAMLHLPLLQTPITERFNKDMINGTNGKMVQHPTYAYLSFVVHDWKQQG